MAEPHHFYVVEDSFVVRRYPDHGRAEKFLGSGLWVDYRDLWDVETNGRFVETEDQALHEALEISRRDEAWAAARGGAPGLTVERLHAAARAAEPILRAIVDGAAAAIDAQPNYGPGDAHAVKPIDALRAKIESRGRLAETVGDAVRGAIIVDEPESVRDAVRAIGDQIADRGGKLVTENKFDAPNATGYGAVHVYLFLETGRSEWIKSEVQIHLRAVYDGTAESVKERTRAMYRSALEAGLGPEDMVRIDQASALAWLRALSSVGG